MLNESHPLVIRLEWVHAVAALRRWEEEVILLKEEARRVICTFQQNSQDWKQEVDHPDSWEPQVLKGYSAYAARQSWVFSVLACDAQSILQSVVDARGGQA